MSTIYTFRIIHTHKYTQTGCSGPFSVCVCVCWFVCLWPGRLELQLQIDVAHTFNCSMSHDIHVLCVCFILIMSMVSFQLFMHMSVRSFSILYNQIEFSHFTEHSIKHGIPYNCQILIEIYFVASSFKVFHMNGLRLYEKKTTYIIPNSIVEHFLLWRKKQSQIAETIKNAPFENNLDFQQLRVREKERCFLYKQTSSRKCSHWFNIFVSNNKAHDFHLHDLFF